MVLGLIAMIFNKISDLASRAVFFGVNFGANIVARYSVRIKGAYKRGNYPVLAFLILTPAALLGFGYFTGLLNYVINFSLSFVFFFFNLFYFLVHTVLYVILFLPIAAFSYGLHFIAAFWDWGIIAKLPLHWLSTHLPSATSYVNELNLIPLLNVFFFGAHAASMAGGNASFGDSFGLMQSPLTLGDFTWRPVTVDLNNPNRIINPPVPRNSSVRRSIWVKPVTQAFSGSSGGISSGYWSGNGGADPTVEPGSTDSTGPDSATYWLNYPDDSGGTNTVNYGSNVGAGTLKSSVISALGNSGTSLSAIHQDIDSHTGGTVANYNPLSGSGIDFSSLGSTVSSAISSAITQPGKVISTAGSVVSDAIGKISSWW